MTDRLERTLTHFIDDGRLPPDVATDISREYHHRDVDPRQRIAELSAYAGAVLVTIGLIVIGTNVWTSFTDAVRVAIPAVASAGLLFGTWWAVHAHPQHAVWHRAAQVAGEVSAVLAVLAVVMIFQRPGGYNGDWDWHFAVATGVGLLVSFVVSRWAPGVLTTLGTGILALLCGISVLQSPALWHQGPDLIGFYMIGLGATAALVLYRWFPPPWLTLVMGMVAWLQGTMILLLAMEPGIGETPDEPLRWAGRLSALALVVIGTWIFARGGEWPWAVGAALAAAMLVGLWSLVAVNAGVALLLAGAVLLAVGAALFAYRRATTLDHGRGRT